LAANQPEITVDNLFEAARRPDVLAAMEEFFAETDRLIAQQPATCWNRGDCCRFATFGHRLYVTPLEVCYYLAKGGPPRRAAVDACPHAYAGMCHARNRRPLGCRVFYCDPAAQGWQGPLTEDRLGVLRSLHETLNVPYFYADWMTVLRALTTVSADEITRGRT